MRVLNLYINYIIRNCLLFEKMYVPHEALSIAYQAVTNWQLTFIQLFYNVSRIIMDKK